MVFRLLHRNFKRKLLIVFFATALYFIASHMHLKRKEASRSDVKPYLTATATATATSSSSPTTSTKRFDSDWDDGMIESETCQPTTNFAYIKMHKSASETLTSIFRRFGYERNSSFVLPLGNKLYVGWPYQTLPMYYRPTKTGEYNILCEHSVYNKTILKELMPKDTVYITSMREPFVQFKSMFNYYNVDKKVGISDKTDPITIYLNNVNYYEEIYKSHDLQKTRHCIPDNFSMTYNLMSFNLGFPTGAMGLTQDLSNDESAIKSWLDDISRTFQHVLIVEYFEESLVLLRRKLCWTWRDIIYKTGNNVLKYPWKSQENPNNRKIYEQWSKVDVILYDHFNRTFWEKVKQERDLHEEVAAFKETLINVNAFCKTGQGSYIVPANPWTKQLTITQDMCLTWHKMLKVIKEKYENMESTVEMKQHPEPEEKICWTRLFAEFVGMIFILIMSLLLMTVSLFKRI